MRFQKYLTEGRSKPLTREDVTDLLRKECSDSLEAYKNGYTIFRALDNNNPFLITSPKGDRISAFSEGNYYTLWINNSELWNKFPKRSIICASGKRASNHGADSVFHVFPFNGAKIGVCPEDDIWDSFKELRNMKIDANTLNKILNNLVGKHLDWREFKEKSKTLYPDQIDDMNLSVFDKRFLINWDSTEDNLYDYLTDLLDPKHNDFNLKSTRNYDITWNDDKEVWTDEKCVLLDKRQRKTKEILNELIGES